MSNSLAIASVTATLRMLLVKNHINVTVRPLDKAPDGIDAGNQRINLFLYQALPDAAFRNMDMPGRVKSGETGHPPLPLTLHYLLTAYSGDEMDQTKSHALLGKAMRIFHDHPVLGAAEIGEAVGKGKGGDLSESDLDEQVERIRITPQPLLFEEMSKLWTTFQIHYRLSAAYQVSVVLIESARPTRTPLPVLIRQIDVQASMMSPFPTLTEIRVPNREPSERLKTLLALPEQQPSAELGDELLIKGHHLGESSVVVQLMHPLLKKAVEIPVKNGTDKELHVTLSNKPTELPAGFYTVAAHITPIDPAAAGNARMTNALSLSLCPKITLASGTLRRDRQGTVTVTVDCIPHVRPEQRVVLLLGERAVPAEKLTRPMNQLQFRVPNLAPGDHFVRLSVDEVRSLLVDWSKTPPEFDATMKVTVQ